MSRKSISWFARLAQEGEVSKGAGSTCGATTKHLACVGESCQCQRTCPQLSPSYTPSEEAILYGRVGGNTSTGQGQEIHACNDDFDETEPLHLPQSVQRPVIFDTLLCNRIYNVTYHDSWLLSDPGWQ